MQPEMQVSHLGICASYACFDESLWIKQFTKIDFVWSQVWVCTKIVSRIEFNDLHFVRQEQVASGEILSMQKRSNGTDTRKQKYVRGGFGLIQKLNQTTTWWFQCLTLERMCLHRPECVCVCVSRVWVAFIEWHQINSTKQQSIRGRTLNVFSYSHWQCQNETQNICDDWWVNEHWRLHSTRQSLDGICKV